MAGPRRVLGVDFGTKRIGLAVSDPDRAFAFPAGILERRGTRRDLDALAAFVVEREIGRIVVGLPLHMDGRRGPEAEAAQAFARQLGEVTGLPVDLLDERWTTVEAERALREARGGRRSRAKAGGERGDAVRAARRSRAKSGRRRGGKEWVDSAAATILLRTYLAQRARGGFSGNGR